jgi:hypothetical protein
MGFTGFIAKTEKPAALLFEVRRQLLLLLFQGSPAVLQPDFLFHESRLLRGDCGGLDPQGFVFLLECAGAGRCSVRGRMRPGVAGLFHTVPLSTKRAMEVEERVRGGK